MSRMRARERWDGLAWYGTRLEFHHDNLDSRCYRSHGPQGTLYGIPQFTNFTLYGITYAYM